MYANQTTVTIERSKSELKRVIYNNGASNYKYGETEDMATVMFSKEARIIRFVITFPPPSDRMFTHTPTGKPRVKDAAHREYDQECRRRWRALILCIKAKFETVASGIASFEEEFLPYILLPNNQTVAKTILPQIAEVYETRKMPKLVLLPDE